MIEHPFPYSVVLFDGVCNLCTASVQFIIKRDPHKHFRFASLQSAVGQKLLQHCHVPAETFDTIVLVEDGQCYTKSTAALKIAKHLQGWWPLLAVLLLIPRRLRDFGYNLIAQNRYTLFGKKTECLLPTADSKERFLDDLV
jgi:predicted DCC family thiol-disulfide oxidoreductase YuxK